MFHYLKSPKDSQQCIKALNDLAPTILGDHSLPSELLYGRVGFLYALLFVKKHCPGAVKEELLVQVGRLELQCKLREGAAVMQGEGEYNSIRRGGVQ